MPTEKDDLALQVPCTLCGVGIGEACKALSGKKYPRKQTHGGRRERAIMESLQARAEAEDDTESGWNPFDYITHEDNGVWPGPWTWFCDACGVGTEHIYHRTKEDAIEQAIEHVAPDEGEEPGDHEIWIRSALKDEMFDLMVTAIKATTPRERA